MEKWCLCIRKERKRGDHPGYDPGVSGKKVVDTVGAGDGFAVGVLSGLLKGLPVSECAKRGNAIGSIQVQHRGDNEGLPTEEILQTYMLGNIQK